ncbi:MAG: hypothetical protein JWR15_2955 [Prosthecobacter sp.]|nr:hypothetical protein [Prosthecobacter sp.]
MSLTGSQLETLQDFIKVAFNPEDLHQLVRLKLGADMYKEWVPVGLPFKDTVYKLLEALEEIGLTAAFLDVVIAARGGKDGIQAVRDMRAAMGPVTQTVSQQVGAVRLGVEGVSGKMDVASVRKIVVDSQAVLGNLAEQITLLRCYKSIHDALHTANMQFRSLENAAKQMAKDPGAAADFSNLVTSFETIGVVGAAAIQNLPEMPLSVQHDEMAWLDHFNDALAVARKAADDGDPVASRQGVQEIQDILRREPSRVDGKLSRTAEALDLSKLQDIFLAAAGLPELVNGSGALLEGRTACEQLRRTLNALVNQHSDWQDIDRRIAGADDIMRLSSSDDPWDFDALWKAIKEASTKLIVIEPGSKWSGDLSASVTKVDASRTNLDWKQLTVEFSRFRQQATVRFFFVDSELNKVAGEVDVIGTPLRNLLSKA